MIWYIWFQEAAVSTNLVCILLVGALVQTNHPYHKTLSDNLKNKQSASSNSNWTASCCIAATHRHVAFVGPQIDKTLADYDQSVSCTDQSACASQFS